MCDLALWSFSSFDISRLARITISGVTYNSFVSGLSTSLYVLLISSLEAKLVIASALTPKPRRPKTWSVMRDSSGLTTRVMPLEMMAGSW